MDSSSASVGENVVTTVIRAEGFKSFALEAICDIDSTRGLGAGDGFDGGDSLVGTVRSVLIGAKLGACPAAGA